MREVLFFADLNAEFDNIINNALSLISPLTGNLAAGGNDITGLDELAFDDAAAIPSVAGRLRRNGVTLGWIGTSGTLLRLASTNVDSQAILGLQNDAQLWQVYTDTDDDFVIRDSTGATTRVSITTAGVLTYTGSVTLGAGGTIIPAAVSGTPAQHALYRENVVKGWARITVAGGVPALTDSFNVSSITDTGIGTVTVTWDRDFANDDYVCVCSVTTPFLGAVGGASSHLVGSNRVISMNPADPPTAVDPEEYHVIAIGDQ